MASDPNADVQKTTVEARQGTTKPKLIYVLVAGVTLVVIGYIVIGLVQGH